MTFVDTGRVINAIQWAEDNLIAIKAGMKKADAMGSDSGELLYGCLEDEKSMMEELLEILRQ